MIVAERELMLSRPDGTKSSVTVRIGRPELEDHENAAWSCSLQILGLDYPELQPVRGVDSLQALTLGLQIVGDLLTAYQTKSSNQLSWLGEPNLGFPVW